MPDLSPEQLKSDIASYIENTSKLLLLENKDVVDADTKNILGSEKTKPVKFLVIWKHLKQNGL